MPPAVLGGAIAAGGAVTGGVLGSEAQEAAADSANNLLQQASQGYQSIDIPSIQSQVLNLQKIQSAGQLTPEQEQTLQQGQSVLNAYQQNQPAMQAQMGALKYLQGVQNAGGLTVQDRAQLEQAMSQVNNQEKASRLGILQNMAQRGMAGSGAQLASQLSGNEAATAAAAMQGFNAANSAQNRTMQAAMGGAQLGQGIEAQQFGEAQTQAGMQNEIAARNMANAQNVLGQNVARTNYANQYNLGNQQQLNQANAAIANQQQVYNQGLQQQQYQNQLQKQAGVSNALNKQATQATAAGQNQANLYGGLGQAGAKLGTSIMNYNPNSPTTPTISENDQAINAMKPNVDPNSTSPF